MRLWNVHEGTVARVGSQERFNIVGRIDDWQATECLRARLNSGPWQSVPVNLTGRSKARLCAPGDFNADAFPVCQLLPDNVLQLQQVMRDGSSREHSVRFAARPVDDELPFELALRPGDVEEFAQVVDGGWRVDTTTAEPALVIDESAAGYDRIVLFGSRSWTTGYEVTARITVDRWTHYVHNVGLLFKWNVHRTDEGDRLPSAWSTGLAYYASMSPGLRLRFGVNVTYGAQGAKDGDHVLVERPLTRWSRRPRWLLKAMWYLSRGRLVMAQLRPARTYVFRAQVHPLRYSLTVWREGDAEPPPQTVVHAPREHLEKGSVGVIAQNAAVRVHSLVVRPLAP